MLPWERNTTPLLLAPMQGLTNRGLRSLFIDLVRPDVVFTEYVRVQSGGGKVISKNDRLEIQETSENVPLVVQLIGADIDSMVSAAAVSQDLGAQHININLGCPYGRMGKRSAGGKLLQDPSGLANLLAALRSEIQGSFSLKLRAGFEDPAELLSLLPLFEDSGIDFLIVHARTVVQRYSGSADHAITAEVVRRTSLPVIANGDIFTTAGGLHVQQQTGAAGLMLGRGAIGDPFLFQRLRGKHAPVSTPDERRAEVCGYLQQLVPIYQQLFCGEQQALAKLKEILAFVYDPELGQWVRKLRKSKNIARFTALLS